MKASYKVNPKVVIDVDFTNQAELFEEVALVGAVFGQQNGGKYNKENAPRPGIILLDIKLPFKDGFEVLKELKSDKRFKTIPIVMLTTTSKSEDITRALDLGANDYIVKPVSWKDFEMKIRSLGKYWAFTSNSKNRSRSNSK